MATVASIVTNLRANTGQFDKALDGAKRKLREVQTYTQQLQAREAAAANARRAAVNEPRREAELTRFHEQTAQNLQRAAAELAAYESKSVAVVQSNRKQATSFKELNDSLKATFGRGSDFKEFIELVMGAGAIGGIGLLTRALADMAAGFKKSAVDLATGAKTFNEAVNSTLRGIPILGTGGAAIADTVSALSFGGRASMAENDAGKLTAATANQQYAAMVQAMRDAAEGRTPRGAINLQYRQNMARLGQLSSAGGVGPKQYADMQQQIEAERNRALSDLPGGNLFRELVQNFKSTTLLDITPESLLRIRDKLQIGIQSFIGKTANNLAALSAKEAAMDAQEAFDAAARLARDEAIDEADARREANKSQYLSEVKGIYERLKEQESGGALFGGAVVQGSQEDYAMRQRSIFGSNIARKDEKELAREAVQIQKQQLDEAKRTNDLLEAQAEDEGVSFN